jgi:hypothetical protein
MRLAEVSNTKQKDRPGMVLLPFGTKITQWMNADTSGKVLAA